MESGNLCRRLWSGEVGTWGLNAESGSHPEFLNHLSAVRARIGGVPILYEDIRVSADVLTSTAVALGVCSRACMDLADGQLEVASGVYLCRCG